MRGDDWREEELDLIVDTYFAILNAIPTAQRGFKAEAKRALDAKIGRGVGSIDFKLGNLSYIATQIGLPALPGFAPAPKAQKGSIYSAFERYISAHPEVLSDEAYLDLGLAAGGPLGGGPSGCKLPKGALQGVLPVEPVPSVTGSDTFRPEDLVRLIRKFDPARRDHRNRVLGRLGEQRVLAHEIARLTGAGRMDLAKRVEWTADTRGDGAGYDIRSFEPDGSDLLIEVKATKGGPTTDFFLTKTEIEVSAERPDAWRLYRLHSLPVDPRLFVIPPPLERMVALTPETWRARF